MDFFPSFPSSSLGTHLSGKLRFVGVDRLGAGHHDATPRKQSFQDNHVTKLELGHEGGNSRGSVLECGAAAPLSSAETVSAKLAASPATSPSAAKSGGGPPHSKTLPRWSCPILRSAGFTPSFASSSLVRRDGHGMARGATPSTRQSFPTSCSRRWERERRVRRGPVERACLRSSARRMASASAGSRGACVWAGAGIGRAGF